jgi:hypothetical protein
MLYALRLKRIPRGLQLAILLQLIRNIVEFLLGQMFSEVGHLLLALLPALSADAGAKPRGDAGDGVGDVLVRGVQV